MDDDVNVSNDSLCEPWKSSSIAHTMKHIPQSLIPVQGAQGMENKPWRPTIEFDNSGGTIDTNQPINNIPAIYTGMKQLTTQPLRFPNLVEGFERNPEYAARTALSTRYTPGEWLNNCLSKYSESDGNREHAERLKNETVRAMREKNEKVSQSQHDANYRLSERITDLHFWVKEMSTETEKLIKEVDALDGMKRIVLGAQNDLEAPLHIAMECLHHRECRKGIEKVHDHVEEALLFEIDNIRKCQKLISKTTDEINETEEHCRSIQHLLEQDMVRKESATQIDKVCHQLTNNSRGISYYSGVEDYESGGNTMKSWKASNINIIQNSQQARVKSAQLRSKIETAINRIANSVKDFWANTNNALQRRSSEMIEAKNKIQQHLNKVLHEIFEVEKYITLTKKALTDHSKPMKAAQTRLEARTHREGIELCQDSAQGPLRVAVHEIKTSIQFLHQRLEELEGQHKQLMKTKYNLEVDLKGKVDALFIDQEKCMAQRRSFPINIMVKH